MKGKSNYVSSIQGKLGTTTCNKNNNSKNHKSKGASTLEQTIEIKLPHGMMS